MKPDIPILIPAAGQSLRMQPVDKLSLEIDGMPLLRRTATHALATGAPVFVTLPSPPHRRYEFLEGMEVVRVPVPDAAEGICASLRRGVAALPSGVRGVMILLADMPALSTDHLMEVFREVDARPTALAWRGTTEAGKLGHPVVLARQFFPELAELSGDTGAGSLLAHHSDGLVPVKLPDEVARIDLDTPEAWKSWLANRK